MFSFNGGAALIETGTKFWVMAGVAAIVSFFGLAPGVLKWQERVLSPEQGNGAIIAMTVFSVIFFILNVSAVTSTGFNPFIYFRF